MNIDYDSKDITLTICVYDYIAFVLLAALVFSVIIFFLYRLFTYIGT